MLVPPCDLCEPTVGLQTPEWDVRFIGLMRQAVGIFPWERYGPVRDQSVGMLV